MFDVIIQFFPKQLEGAGYTVSIAVLSVLIGTGLGTLIAFARMSKNFVFNGFAKFYVWLFRGTPLLLQIFFVYYALPSIVPALNISSPFIVALIAFGFNSAAYMAEIIRAAIQSIDKGQMEAAKALGMKYGQAMRRVVIPQSIRRMVPALGNEFVTLIKDTSLVSVMGLSEIMRISNQIQTSRGEPMIYLSAVALYLVMTTLLTFLFNKIEKKYSVYE